MRLSTLFWILATTAYGAKMQAKINRQIEMGRKHEFIFTDVNGKNREYVRLIPYEKALAKNKAEREKRARAKTPTPKVKERPIPKSQ
jgi:hypothetical protein